MCKERWAFPGTPGGALKRTILTTFTCNSLLLDLYLPITCCHSWRMTSSCKIFAYFPCVLRQNAKAKPRPKKGQLEAKKRPNRGQKRAKSRPKKGQTELILDFLGLPKPHGAWVPAVVCAPSGPCHASSKKHLSGRQVSHKKLWPLQRWESLANTVHVREARHKCESFSGAFHLSPNKAEF